jgi:twitching motility protein PilJ
MATKSSRGRASTGIPVLLLVVALIGLTIGLGFVFYALYRDAEYDRASAQMAADVQALADQLPLSAALAALGDADARALMSQQRNRMAAIWAGIDGDLARQLPAAGVAAFEAGWAEVQRAIDSVAVRSEAAGDFRNAVARVRETLPALQAATAHLGKTLVNARASATEVDAAYSLAAWAEQFDALAAALLQPDSRVADSLAALRELQQRFARTLDGLRNGDPALELSAPRNQDVRYELAATADRFRALGEALAALQPAADQVIAGQTAADHIAAGNRELATQAKALADHIRALGTGAGVELLPGLSVTALAILGVGLLVAGLAALAFILVSDSRRRLRETATANQANQDAILRLLNEIEGLAEGDLTVEATVTQDFTGAIADAINYAIQQLRELVARIEEAATDVSAASDRTRATALELSEAAESQAREIASASAAISEMAITIDQVSANATESAAVAERSVSIATQGASVVQNTIAGMDRIREQIQETAKRIKRLGESSQEIGDIVSLIGDIADQTNVLALNAAIQASMAGDAGRGFAVVADEVQRLAERSANATKQIATLVAAIQADTGAAVASMEQTTAEVVAGAALSQNAGVALGQIQTVSTDLAELIQDISTAARHQSSTAGHISNTMNVIQEITSRTLEQANQTAHSIGELADMAIELRESVSGFRLPAVQRRARAQPQRADPTPGGPPAPGAGAAAAPPAAQRPPAPQPHIAAVLAESSARLDELDRQPADTDPATWFSGALEDELDAKPPDSEPRRTLGAELAEIDLDEFDLDRDQSRR